jgi:2-polyprenyl-6-methoxyphenol hydroxylase-like FAD-dependent oxidoreductase
MAGGWRKITDRLSRVFARAAAPAQISPRYTIAVVGAGTAGLAAAAFLQQSGHNVTLYEKSPAPGPVGAGLLLQPTGLAVLSRLGLDGEAIARGSVVRELAGSRAGEEHRLLDIRYGRLAPHLHGVGIHRGALFTLLHEKAKAVGVTVTCGVDITSRRFDENRRNVLVARDGTTYGPFDLVVDAQGLHSTLRKDFAAVKRDEPYPFGALWGVVRDTGDPAWRETLVQRYRGAETMIGVLPLGKPDPAGPPLAAFFFSLKRDAYPAWKNRDFGEWKREIAEFWPEVAPLVEQFKSPADLTFGNYSDVVLKRFHAEGMVFIGDAAHATSPQLGQGANMALVDAMTLDRCLSERPKLGKALAQFTKERLRHVHFYQAASRRLTPFFQSDGKTAPALRDLVLGPLCRAPVIKKEMAKTLSGVKTGPFTQLDPGRWGKGYGPKSK